MAKDLDYLLTVYHLLNVAVRVANRFLLRHEIAAGKTCYLSCEGEHDTDEAENEQRHGGAGFEHGKEHGDYRDERRYDDIRRAEGYR